MSYIRIQLATSVQPNTLYQIDGRIDTILLGDDGFTRHHRPDGTLVTSHGRDLPALEAAAMAGTLWECQQQ